jgi:WD40 repeat protein
MSESHRLFLVGIIGLAALLLNSNSLTSKEFKVLEGHTRDVRCLAFAPNGKTLYSCGADGTVRAWDFEKGKDKVIVELPDEVLYRMTLSPDGSLLAVYCGAARPNRVRQPGVLRVYDPVKSKLVWNKVMAGPMCLAFCPDGKTLATASDEKKDNCIKLWEPGTGEEIGRLKGGDHLPMEIVFSRDSKLLAVGDDAGQVRVWDMANKKLMTDFEAQKKRDINSLAFSKDAKMLAVGCFNRKVKLYDWKKEKEIDDLAAECNNSGCLAYSPNGKLLAAQDFGGIGKDLCLFDTEFYRQKAVFIGDKESIYAVAFSPNGELIATADDKVIRLWKVPKEE